MTDSLIAIEDTDRELTALATRRGSAGIDPLLSALDAWVAVIDAAPEPETNAATIDVLTAGARPRGLRAAAGLVVAAAMVSSGTAAAVSGDPMAPFSYVADQIRHLTVDYAGDRPAPDDQPEAPQPDSTPPGAGVGQGGLADGLHPGNADDKALGQGPDLGRTDADDRDRGGEPDEPKPAEAALPSGVEGAPVEPEDPGRPVDTDPVPAPQKPQTPEEPESPEPPQPNDSPAPTEPEPLPGTDPQQVPPSQPDPPDDPALPPPG